MSDMKGEVPFELVSELENKNLLAKHTEEVIRQIHSECERTVKNIK